MCFSNFFSKKKKNISNGTKTTEQKAMRFNTKISNNTVRETNLPPIVETPARRGDGTGIDYTLKY